MHERKIITWKRTGYKLLSTLGPSRRSGLFILSAVRTPVGLLNGVLSQFTATQLGSFAIKEALQRAVVPYEDLKNLFLTCTFRGNNCQEEIVKRTGLTRTAKVKLLSGSGMKCLIKATKFLLTTNEKVCLAGGMESTSNSSSSNSQLFPAFIKNIMKDSKKGVKNNLLRKDLNNFLDQDFRNFMEANSNGAFYDEIVRIDFKKKGQHIMVAEDELFKNATERGSFNKGMPKPGDGAAALIISTKDYLKDNQLVPLARIISFAEKSSTDLAAAQHHAIEKALKIARCQHDEIVRWEIVSVMNDIILNCTNYFNINSTLVNKDGGVFSLGYPVGVVGVKAVCHLIHALRAGELGCAATCDFDGTASAIIVEKLNFSLEAKPLLTLYTKHTCSLCDDLKHQLKPFEGRFVLEEVDIEAKENEKFKELFQYDIPVLFMNGMFVCKHSLDAQHFSRRLTELENLSLKL